GGKFANGAWTAAFVSRFNHDGTSSRRANLRETINSIENLDVSESVKGKLFEELNRAVALEKNRLLNLSPTELADFFGLLPTDRSLPIYQQQFAADLQLLQLYAGQRASGVLAGEAYSASGIAGTFLGALPGPAAQIASGALQTRGAWRLFGPSRYGVSFSCVGDPLYACAARIGH
ncbi:MAG: hypothetical protein EA384_10390, partial [Spirochaetaceae bacterium]